MSNRHKQRSGEWGGRLAVAAAIIATGAGLAFLIVSSPSGGASASPSGSNLKFSETSWDLGDVSMKDGLNRKTIEVTNTGGEAITVDDLSTSCMCTSVTIVHADGRKSPTKGMPGHGDGGMAGHSATSDVAERIESGETVELLVEFDPNAHGPEGVGYAKRTISLKTAEGQSATLNFSALITR